MIAVKNCEPADHIVRETAEIEGRQQASTQKKHGRLHRNHADHTGLEATQPHIEERKNIFNSLPFALASQLREKKF